MFISKLLRIPITVILDTVKLIIIFMPGSFGNKLRRLYYRKKLKRMGKNVVIDVGVQIDGPELISIGNNVHIDKYCIISTGKKLVGNVIKNKASFRDDNAEIIIGNNIHIAHFCILMGYGGISIGSNSVLSSGCKLYSLTNTPNNINDPTKITSVMPYNQSQFLLSSIVLEENVWLGLNTVVMPGVLIEKDSFSAVSSLITKSFKNNSYIGGAPARLLKNRFDLD